MIRRTNRIWVALAVLVLAAIATISIGSNAQAQSILPPLDIVFIIDESGSMGPDIADVKARVNEIATQLETSTDPRYALVGFGAYSGHGGVGSGLPHTHTNFTNKAGFSSALTSLIANGGFEPGVEATSYAMHNISGYRSGAGVCAVLITDEDSDGGVLSIARSALDSRSAVWFGIVWPGYGNTSTMYGPSPGSLSAHTGGSIFHINAFRADAGPVLNALLNDCIIAITQGVVLTPGTDTNFVGEQHTVLATVKDSLGNPIGGKVVTFRVTAGPNAGTTASASTNSNGEVTFTYTGNGGPGTDTIEASFVDDQGATITSRSVEKIWELPPEADVAIEASGILNPPEEIFVSVPVEVILQKVVTNNGPAQIIDALVTKIATAPAGCDVSPLTESEQVEDLALGEFRTILERFIIHCSEPSFHTFEFANEIVVTTPGVTDPILVNNQLDASLTVASIAYSDGAVLEMFVVDPPESIDVSDEVPVTVREIVRNNGPFGPTPFLVVFNAEAPDGCNMEGPSQLLKRVILPVGVATPVDATFAIHCSEPSFHEFIFDNAISPLDQHVIDRIDGNNTGNTSLTVASIAYADVEIVDWNVPSPFGYLDGILSFGAGDLLISEWVTIRTVKTLHNRGGWGPVDAIVTTSVDAPGIDVSGPDGFTAEGLEVSVPMDFNEDFEIHCYEPCRHTITLLNEITGVDPDDIHVVDPNPDNDWIERTLVIECVIPVPVDVKPQSCRNPFQVDKNGVLPIAILGTAGFDVTQIDPASVRLEGIAALRWELEDVATPFEPYVGKEDAFDCTEEGADGYLDLTLKFDAQEIAAALGEVSDGDVLVLHLRGAFHEEIGSHIFYGEDVIVILEKGK